MNEYLNKLIDLKIDVRSLTIEHWLHHELFSLIWWVWLASSIAALVVLWIYVDRKRILEICVFGLIINVFSNFLDIGGSEYALWAYPIQLLPNTTVMYPVDYFLLPALKMLIYQRYNTWKSFLVASAVASAILSFVMEPLVVWAGGYVLVKWEYAYSFPIYIAVAVLAKALTHLILARQRSAE
ncbi:MAG: CBO0543 family protein [Acidobacteriota bacterium]